MKRIIHFTLLLQFTLILSVAGQKKDDCNCKVSFNPATRYPTAKFQDYAPSNVHAKVAYPTQDGMVRVWIKGDKSYSTALILTVDEKIVLTDSIRLHEPFYTKIASVHTLNHIVKVKFFSGDKSISLHVAAVHYQDLMYTTENFSILFYGCFQPFTVDKKTKEPKLITESTFDSPGNLNKNSRDYFKQISLGYKIEHATWTRNKLKPRNFDCVGHFNSPLLPNPKLVIGTGDQVYLDAGYKYKKRDKHEDVYKDHPLSAWAYMCCDPEPLLSVESFTEHLHKTYSAFSSFTTLDTVFKTLPSINIWDDHEIRDGWGSHGDEYDVLTDVINPKLSPYFSLSKRAFVEHQWQSGINEPNANAEDLSQHFEYNNIAFFAFDLRSFRNINKNIILGDSQFEDFIEWCNGLRENQLAVILSSIPFFYGNTPYMEKLAINNSKGELNDDIKDSWGHNKFERDRILAELIKLRARKIKPVIVSGDIHTGALTEVWYQPNPKGGHSKSEVLCYELVASGLSHESLGEGQGGIIKQGRHRTENQRWNDPGFLILGDAFNIYPSVRMSRSDLNFGALEISKDSIPKLHLFTLEKYGKKKSLLQHTMDIDFSKTSEADVALRYRTFKQRFFSLFTYTFSPANVEQYKVTEIKD
jgi:hypothetical protein